MHDCLAFTDSAIRRSNLPAPIRHHDAHRPFYGRIFNDGRDRDLLIGRIGNDIYRPQVALAGCLQPNRLPDSRDASVEAALRLQLRALFASRLIFRLWMVFSPDDEGVLYAEVARNIKGERGKGEFITAEEITLGFTGWSGSTKGYIKTPASAYVWGD